MVNPICFAALRLMMNSNFFLGGKAKRKEQSEKRKAKDLGLFTVACCRSLS
jgi:hypothetical protein